jgi:putative flippase GtrA
MNRLPPGLLGQGLRYVMTGATVLLVYLLSTLVLSDVVGLPFQVALAIGFCLALALHFTLQRMFVWAQHDGEYALPFRHQVRRYLLVAGAQYGITAASVALLPAALGLPTEVVYVATVLLTASANFLLFRHSVFHAAPETAPAACGPAVKVA